MVCGAFNGIVTDTPAGGFEGAKWLHMGLLYIAEMAAEMVTKHAKWRYPWLRVVETCTLRAVFSRSFGCGEFY